ncbi:hypothetical protein FA13DRAFT_1795430 [Coprinellus micaceus]|uniref:Uncharacterized protein n=1 Tax=Coprinellus micaceus TaxID=71717 RepID=A0A4Y7SY00_COPMI|nr:hypothetical protein FA13DRAFT_1795430 [Coprinellus micaceus]
MVEYLGVFTFFSPDVDPGVDVLSPEALEIDSRKLCGLVELTRTPSIPTSILRTCTLDDCCRQRIFRGEFAVLHRLFGAASGNISEEARRFVDAEVHPRGSDPEVLESLAVDAELLFVKAFFLITRAQEPIFTTPDLNFMRRSRYGAYLQPCVNRLDAPPQNEPP